MDLKPVDVVREAKAMVEGLTANPLDGRPLRLSEAKVLYTTAVWLILGLDRRGIRFRMERRDDETSTYDHIYD